jgi:protein-S-isoprenylcysteine O-methyltransferase Ste14
MALIEEFDKTGNWLFKGRSYFPLALYAMAAVVIGMGWDEHLSVFDETTAWICIAISLLGLLIRAIAIGYAPRGTSGRNTKEGQVAEVLNSTGIYSTVRHPLYLGNFFMWLGIIIYVGNWWFTLTCCLMYWIYYERIMFAEEFFLRGKFGQVYLDWAAKTPSFVPALSKWKAPTWEFSLKNVLKREYNGFFAIFFSMALLDVFKNYMHYGFTDWTHIMSPFWMKAVIVSFIIFLTLRSLKKYTRILHVEGR